MTTQDLFRRKSGIAERLLRKAASALAAYFRRSRFNRLQDLDDAMLDDIGVTRAEIEIATRMPFSRDASAQIRRLRQERRRQERALLGPFDVDAATDLYRKSHLTRR